MREIEEQPEQEPVAWGVDWGKAGDIPCVSIIKRFPDGGIEVIALEYAPYSYTDPPQRAWVGLTPEEIHAVIRAGEYDSMEEFACVIESKLRSKNHA